MYKNILLAADGSDNSFRAAQETIKLLSEDSEVTILNVLDASKSKDEVLHSAPSESIGRKRKEKLSKIEALYRENNVTYDVQFAQGIPNETVVKHANNGTYDIVVLGSRGLNTLQEMMLGSVSHKVTKRSDIPVLIVK